MKRYAPPVLLLLALCFSLCAPQPARAQAMTKAALQTRMVVQAQLRHDLFYGALDASAQTGDVAGTLKILSEGLSAPLGQMNPTEVALQWLMDNTFDQVDAKKVNAFYFMVLADLKTPLAIAFQQTGKDALFKEAAQLALKSLMTYEILAMTDAERCDDPSVEKVIQESLGPRYMDLAFAFKALTKEQFDLLGYYATELERLKAERPLNALLCSKGDKAKTDPNYKPKDLEPGLWMQRRTDLRLLYKNLWSKRYYEYQKPQPTFSAAPESAHTSAAVPGVPTDMPISPNTPATVTPPVNPAPVPGAADPVPTPGITNPAPGTPATDTAPAPFAPLPDTLPSSPSTPPATGTGN